VTVNASALPFLNMVLVLERINLMMMIIEGKN